MNDRRGPRPSDHHWGLDAESSRQLAKARVPDDGMCWWCKKRPATTAEHKYKATDLRRMASLTENGHPDPRSLYRSGAQFTGELKTLARGPAVQWAKSMCKACNGGRDRHMDAAYEAYSDYVWNEQDALARARAVDWPTIYGANWPTAVRDLGRYYAKQVGCLLAQQSLPVPPSLVDFMDGAANAEDFVFAVIRDRGRRSAHRMAKLRGIDARAYWLPPAPATLTADCSRVASFSYQAYIGFIAVNVDYAQGLQHPSFFELNPSPILQVTGVSPWRVRATMALAVIRERIGGAPQPPD